MKKIQPTWRYRLLLRFLSPVLLTHLVWRSTRDGGWRYLQQRLGFSPVYKKTTTWIHAASVGEVMTVMPLVHRLVSQQPAESVLITTNTPTGASIVNKSAPAGVRHVYLPLDWPGACQRFLQKQNPMVGWLVETEIWPQLYARCATANVDLAIINGRVSKRTLRHSEGVLASTYQRALAAVRVLAKSDEDAQRFIQLGAPRHQVSTLGNLKFADNRPTQKIASILPTPYCLAASTHADEELRLAQAWLSRPDAGLLVLVPRHVERGKAILQQVQALQQSADPDLPQIAQRSKGAQPASGSRLYLADTLGELQAWYCHASAVFVGGSLIDHGGHNVLEPARFAKAIVVGPSIENFADVVQILEASNALIRVENAQQVITSFQDLIARPNQAKQIGKNAQQVAAQSNAVVEEYLQQLLGQDCS